MTGAPRPDPPGNADRGTQLGAGTRLLASLFRLPVRAVRAIGTVLSRAGSIGRRGWFVIALVVMAAGIASAVAVAGPRESLSATGDVALTILAYAVAILIVIVIPLAVLVGIVRAAPAIGRAIARAARFLWRPFRGKLRPIVRAIGNAIVVVARFVGRAITVVAVPTGHALATAARAAGHALATASRALGHAITVVAVPTGHALATASRALGHAITVVAVPTGHALATAARAVHRALATAADAIASLLRAVGRAIVLVFTPVGRAIARGASAARRTVLAPIGHALTAVGAVLGRVLGRATDRVVAFFSECTRWVTTHVLRLRHSIGVAAARARQSTTSAAPTPSPAEPPRIATPPPPFTAEVFHNEYLPAGGRSVDAVVTVTALTHPDRSDDRVETAEVVLVDCSGSMGHPWRKIRAARAATVAAIDALPDGAYFAIVRANHDAEVVYPMHGGLAIKDADTTAEARRAVQGLWPEGGTTMGRWLLLARDLLGTAPHAIGHAILLTDGKNESESPEALTTARHTCRGRFQCDCRGVGTDWDVSELRGIAEAMLGTVDIVADPGDLAADFRAMAERAAAKRVDGVALRVWTPAESTVRFVKQVSPSIEDLGVRAVRVDARTVDYPTGAWSHESRDYHLSIELPEKSAGTEMLAARVSLVVDGHVLSKALVTATWTEDLELSTRIVPEVVHYTGQAELLGAVQDGLARRRDGDEVGALARLGDAARRAYETGNEATLQLIAKVVEIEDTPTGRVRARAAVDDADVMALETRSTRTTRFSVPIDPVRTVSSD